MRDHQHQAQLQADSKLEVTVEDPRHRVGANLLRLLAAELSSLYPEEAAGLVSHAELAAPRGGFVVAGQAGRALGCGAFRRIDDHAAEVKHMYVTAAARGRGVGRAILRELERRAWLGGYAQLRLETGLRQHAAIGLYRSEGYRQIARYGEFVDNPLSVCFEKNLRPLGP